MVNREYYTPEVASALHIDLLTGVWTEKKFPPLSYPIDPEAPRWYIQDGQWTKTLGETTA